MRGVTKVMKNLLSLGRIKDSDDQEREDIE